MGFANLGKLHLVRLHICWVAQWVVSQRKTSESKSLGKEWGSGWSCLLWVDLLNRGRPRQFENFVEVFEIDLERHFDYVNL